MAAFLTTVIGIVASIVVAYAFYWLGSRSSRAEKQELLDELADLRALVSNLFRQGARHADHSRPTPSSTPDAPAGLELLISAALGALVNARGEVPLGRLRREVTEAMGQTSTHEVQEVLTRFRAGGVIDWEGPADTLDGVKVLRVKSSRPKVK